MFKKIIKFFKNWFEKNGIIKILVTFIILFVSVLIGLNTNSFLTLRVCNIIATISMAYIILTMLIFTIAGIVNWIKDMRNK